MQLQVAFDITEFGCLRGRTVSLAYVRVGSTEAVALLLCQFLSCTVSERHMSITVDEIRERNIIYHRVLQFGWIPAATVK